MPEKKYALVVASEVLSRVTNFADRNTCVLFGDGAGAAVITLDENSRYAFDCGAEGTLTGKELLAADIDGNGSVDSTDLFELLRYCAEKGAGLQPTWTEILG